MPPDGEQQQQQQLPPAPRQTPPAEDPEVARLRSEVARSRQDLDALRSRITAQPAPAAGNGQGMSPAEMAREFYKDPIAHSAAIAQRVVQDTLRAEGEPTRQTMIQMAKSQVRAKDEKLFDKYYLEIEAAVNTVAPQFHGNITVWENALKLVKGNHIDEIIAERAAASGQPPAGEPRGNGDSAALHIRQGDGPAPPSPRQPQATAGTELSADEKHVARKLGLTEEQYKAGKAHLEGQNDPVRDPVGKSSWDGQITFDSRERRRKIRATQLAQRRAS